MRAGDGDPALAEHDRGERGRPVQHPQPTAAGLGQFRVAVPDRGGHDERVSVADVRRGVPDVHLRAECRQPGQHVRAGRVAAGYGHSPGQHDPGDPRHARTADAGEVHPAQFVEADRIHRSHQAHAVPLPRS